MDGLARWKLTGGAGCVFFWCVVLLQVCGVSGNSGVAGSAIDELVGGIICRKSEELAILAVYGKLLAVAMEFRRPLFTIF